MSVTADFQTQFEALVRGLTEAEVAFVRSEIETATVKFLKNVFGSLATRLTRLSVSVDSIGYAPNSFGYKGQSAKITKPWQIQKNKGFGLPPLTEEPRLFRGLSRKKGKTSLVELLRKLGGSKSVGTKLYTGLGGLDISPIASGSSALKPGLVYSPWTGKAYNPNTQEYVSWESAVIPAVNHYLKQGAVRPSLGVKVGSNNRVSVSGRRGQISIQRALVEGLASAGINVSYLEKLNSFLGASAQYDELADLMAELGLISEKDQQKIGHLAKYDHAILLPYFGGLLSNSGDDSLTAFLRKEGVL